MGGVDGVGSVDVTNTGATVGSGGGIVSAVSISHSRRLFRELVRSENGIERKREKREDEDGLEVGRNAGPGRWWVEEVRQQQRPA